MTGKTLNPHLSTATFVGTLLNAGLALRHSLRARGTRGTVIFAALGIGLPALGEYYAVNIDRGIRHHSRPQVRGVPINAALGWWAIASTTHALVADLLTRHGASEATRRWATPIASALVATSLDLVLDPYGLASGIWEWRDDGIYAREITGPNGRSGIPAGNYFAWLTLVGGVVALHGAITRHEPDPVAPPGAHRDAVAILLAYYLPAALWAIATRRPRYLLYSALLPATIALALRPRRAEPGAQLEG
jgi:hypothetical protein